MNEAPKIGLDNVVIAEVLSDDVNGIVYDEVIPLKGAVNATINPNSDVSTDFADNGAFFAANNRGNAELSLEMVDIDPNILSKMLGTKLVNGITRETGMDQAPYFALGFRVWIAGTDGNGKNRYQLVWYAKGKFSVPETGGETKKDSLDFKHVNMSGQFVATQFVPDGEDSGTICVHCRTDNPDVDASVISNWFNQPIVSVAVDTGAVTVSAQLRDDPNNDLLITGSKAGGATFNFAAASVKLNDTIIVTDENGAPIAGTLSVGAASTAPTITFKPALGENEIKGVTITGGLKDTFGVSVTPKTVAFA